MMLWTILYDYALPALLIVLCALAATVLPALAKPFFKWLADRGVVIEESRQRMFQNTIQNGVLEIIRRAGGGAITDHLYEFGVRHVHEGAPDQVDHFKATDAMIERRLRNGVAKELRNANPAVVVEARPEVVQVPERRIAGSASIVR